MVWELHCRGGTVIGGEVSAVARSRLLEWREDVPILYFGEANPGLTPPHFGQARTPLEVSPTLLIFRAMLSRSCRGVESR